MFKLSEEDFKKVEKLKKEHPNERVRTICWILFMRHLKHSRKDTACLAGVHKDTVSSYTKDYEREGLDSLLTITYNKPVSSLEEHRDLIQQNLEANLPHTLKEAVARVEKLTGIKRSIGRMSKFLKSMGFKRLKTGQIPAKAKPEDQKKFLKKELLPRLREARKKEGVFLFGDLAHFVHSVFSGYLWSIKRVFVRSASGRQRWNVLGVVNAITCELLTLCNDQYINASVICEMLRKVAEHYARLETPITIVLDNARYQKCPIVASLAKELNIELLYLPSYSPNLNLIERLWKFVKKEALACKYYETFDGFKKAINDCLISANSEKLHDLKTLLNPRFHIGEKKVGLTI